MSYFNDYGLMRMHKNIEVENGLLFRFRYESYYAYWTEGNLEYEASVSVHRTIVSILSTPEGISFKQLTADPPVSTQHFSRDNMYGLYGMSYMYDKNTLKELPLMFWNNQKGTDKITPWLHPNGFMVFMSLKSKFWSYAWSCPILLMMLFSWVSWLKNKNNTSGLCLWIDILPLLAQQNFLFKKLYLFIRENLLSDVQECQDFYASSGYIWKGTAQDNLDNPLRRLIHEN